MADRLKTISVRQFRERAAEINEPVDIALRDADGNFRILGTFTPYVQHVPGATSLPESTGKLRATVTVRAADGQVVVPEASMTHGSTRVTPFPKSAQTGRKK